MKTLAEAFRHSLPCSNPHWHNCVDGSIVLVGKSVIRPRKKLRRGELTPMENAGRGLTVYED